MSVSAAVLGVEIPCMASRAFFVAIAKSFFGGQSLLSGGGGASIVPTKMPLLAF